MVVAVLDLEAGGDADPLHPAISPERAFDARASKTRFTAPG